MNKTLLIIGGIFAAIGISFVICFTIMNTATVPEPQTVTVTSTVTATPEPAPTVTVTATPEPTPTLDLATRCDTDDWYMDPVCVAAAEGN